MSIISCIEDWRGVSATASDAGANSVAASATRVWTMRSTGAANLEALNALSYGSIPQIGDPHPTDPWLYCQHVSAEASGPNYLIVTATYASIEDPLATKPEVTWSLVSSNEPIDEDIAGNPITNSADETFDPPVQRDINDLCLRIVRHEASYDKLRAVAYQNTVNQTTWWGFSPGQGLIRSIEGVRQVYSGGDYWIVTYEIHLRPDGWKRRILDQGFRTKSTNDDDGKPTYAVCKDADNDQPLSQPVKLDGSGAKLSDGAAAVFLEFDLYEETDWTFLEL